MTAHIAASSYAVWASAPTAGPLSKIERAKEHLDSIDSEIAAFIARQPYRVSIKKDPQDGRNIFRPYLRENIPLAWGIRLGEFAYALRSALDQIAWSLAVKRDHLTCFPISIEESSDFVSRLNRLREDIRADVKAVQPYQGGDRKRNHPLYVLSRINNIDKHRVIVAGLTKLYVATGMKSPKWFFMDGFTRLNEGDVEFEFPRPGKLEDNFQPEMRAQIAFNISEPPIATGDPTRLLLRDLHAIDHFVRNDVYPRFARFF